MAFTPGDTVWTERGLANGCPEFGVGCRGQTGVSSKVGGTALKCAHADCPLKQQIAEAKLNMDEQQLAQLPVQQ